MDFPVNKLKVEEKLQLLEALVPASKQNSKICNTNETVVSSRGLCQNKVMLLSYDFCSRVLSAIIA